MNQSYEFDEGIMEINNEQGENTKLIENTMDKQTKAAKDKVENEGNSIILQEELQFKRNKFFLRYDKTEFDFVHIPNQSKLVKFVSIGFLDDDLQRPIIDNKLDEST